MPNDECLWYTLSFVLCLIPCFVPPVLFASLSFILFHHILCFLILPFHPFQYACLSAVFCFRFFYCWKFSMIAKNLLVGPYCNSNRPPKIVTSSSNLMAIVFLADSSESYRGFKASYRSLERKRKFEPTFVTIWFNILFMISAMKIEVVLFLWLSRSI